MPQIVSKPKTPTKEVIPLKKRIYRKVPVNAFRPEPVLAADLGGRLVFAIDVAKVDMVAALATTKGEVVTIVSWKAPEENAAVLSILRCLPGQGARGRDCHGVHGDLR